MASPPDLDAETRKPDHSDTLARLRLLEPESEPCFDTITTLACDLLSTPCGALSIIDDDGERQFFRSYFGLTGEIAVRRQTGLSHSLCRHVRDTDAPLVLAHIAQDAQFKGHPAHVDLGIKAYLGQPIHLPCGTPIGALCVFSMQPRPWDQTEINRLGALASCIDDAIGRVAADKDAEKARHDAARIAAARTYFLAGLSHEIRTSLNGVIGVASVLDDLPLGDDARPLVQEILRSGEQLHGLLAALLGETDAITSVGQTDTMCNIREIVEEILCVLNSVHPRHAHTINLVVDDAGLGFGTFDASVVKRICYDLIAKVIVASPNGASEIRVAAAGDRDLVILVTLELPDRVGGETSIMKNDLDFAETRRITTAAGGRFDVRRDAVRRLEVKVHLPIISKPGPKSLDESRISGGRHDVPCATNLASSLCGLHDGDVKRNGASDRL